MKNMKLILGVTIGILVGGAIGIKASELISSSQVIYKDDKTVDVALDNLFDELSLGKNKIAEAITEKGVETSDEISLENMAENIALIENSGMTYRAGNVINITGSSMITKTEIVTIPAGVKNAYVILSCTSSYGSGLKVTGDNIVNQTGAYNKTYTVDSVYTTTFKVVELELDEIGGDITITYVHHGSSNTKYSTGYYAVLY